jgi:hypothetical protein
MICLECKKMASLETKRSCIRCSGVITNTISCICDQCSKENSVCSVCLKKMNIGNALNNNKLRPGCKSCGR